MRESSIVSLVAETQPSRSRMSVAHESDSDVSDPIGVIIRAAPRWKRAIDIAGSLILILVLSPVFLFIALYIKAVSNGPVFFCQKRLGRGTTFFVIYKFRTMNIGEPEQLHSDYISALAASNEPAKKPSYGSRLIPGGSLLRKLSLDELPQLFNVLLGTMSLIGPRPDVLELHRFKPWQIRRFEVLPGISGLWQVSGKNRLTFDQMVMLDIEYIDNLSLLQDVKIIFKTCLIIASLNNE